MPKFEIKMPKLGESITEGTILSWSVQAGDNVNEDEVLFEVNSAKVSAEIPSPVAGKVLEILVKEGSTVAVGTVVALIGTTEGNEAPGLLPKEENNPPSSNTAPPTTQPEVSSQEASVPSIPQAKTAQAVTAEETRWYSPAVLRLAQEAGIPQEELTAIPGTGFEGRVSKKDIQRYIAGTQPSGNGTIPTTPSAAQPEQQQTAPIIDTLPDRNPAGSQSQTPPDREIKEMDYIGKIIADHMVLSKRTSPHVTNVVEADVTNLVIWREKNKAAFQQRENIKLTFMPAVTQAVVKALKAYPQINVSVDGYTIIYKKRLNISIAVSLSDGNLITPVIHDADRLSLSGLAQAVDSLAAQARAGKLKPENIEGGTFTITNFGSFQSLFGTPIINQPQVAILGVGVIEKKPAVISTPEGDAIAIRHKMYLSLSYDHRVINGMLAGNFLYAIKEGLENWTE